MNNKEIYDGKTLRDPSFLHFRTSSKQLHALQLEIIRAFIITMQMLPPYYKISRPFMTTLSNRTSICEWSCGCKNRHQKHIMWLQEIGRRAQNLFTILGSIVNINGGVGGEKETYMTI
jgi:hypothetical protein